MTDEAGRPVTSVARGIGPATNNVAEYRACLEGLGLAESLGARRVEVRSDSRLLVEQLSGRFRVKNPTLIRLYEQVRRAAARFLEVAFVHVPREDNREADRLANQGVDEWLAAEGYAPAEPPRRLFD